MSDASARGRSNRNRGAAAERELARWIRDELGIDTSRQLKQYQQAQHFDLTPVGPFGIEAKYHARINVKDWWKQAVVSAKASSLIPVVAYKVARKGWRFVLPYTTNIPGPAQSWRYDYEYTMDVGPACFALIVRESL
jgi:Holliday junction resolvase